MVTVIPPKPQGHKQSNGKIDYSRWKGLYAQASQGSKREIRDQALKEKDETDSEYAEKYSLISILDQFVHARPIKVFNLME